MFNVGQIVELQRKHDASTGTQLQIISISTDEYSGHIFGDIKVIKAVNYHQPVGYIFTNISMNGWSEDWKLIKPLSKRNLPDWW